MDRYYVHFPIHTLEENMKPLIPTTLCNSPNYLKLIYLYI